MSLVENRYKLEELIGEGGMGNVYKGRDTQTDQIVAVKHLKPDVVKQGPDLVERFTHEGDLLRQLNHPNIVSILRSIEEDGQHYLVMEYVEGGSLKELLDTQERLSVRRTLEIALDLADALTRTHRLHITHRDLKPANVLLSKDGTPRLTDFGIARSESGPKKLTMTGSVMGTYHYLSPEACLGQELDYRADIWAFGVMLFEMLTGKMPFDGGHEAAVLVSILNAPVPNITELCSDAPPELVTLIEQMLIKERDERMDSIRLVGAELEAILRDLDKSDSKANLSKSRPKEVNHSRFQTPTDEKAIAVNIPNDAPQATFTPPSQAPSVSKPPSVDTPPKQLPQSQAFFKQPLAWGLAFVGILALALLAFWLSGGFDEEKDQSAPAIPIVTNSSDGYNIIVAKIEAVGGNERDVTRFIVDDLRQKLEREIVASGIHVFAYPEIINSDAEAKAVAEANRAVVVVWGNYNSDFIELEVQIGTSTDFPYIIFSRAQIEEIANIRVRLQNERRESVAPQVLAVLGLLHLMDGDGYEVIRALSLLNDMVAVPAEIMGASVAAYTHRFLLLYDGDSDEKFDAIKTAQQIAPGNAALYVLASSAYAHNGDNDEFKRQIESAQRLEPSHKWALIDYQMANLVLAEYDLETAIDYYDHIIELRPNDWFAYNFRALFYYLMGDYEQAKSDYAQSFALGPQANFPYPFSVSLALREGDIPLAQKLMRESLTSFPDPTLGNRIINAAYGTHFPLPIGPLYAAFGHVVLGQYRNAIDIIDNTQNKQPIPIVELYLLEGVAQCSLGDAEASENAYNQALELDPQFTMLYFLRAQARLEKGDLIGMQEDIAKVQESDLWSVLAPYALAGINGDLNCLNFFSYQLPE